MTALARAPVALVLGSGGQVGRSLLECSPLPASDVHARDRAALDICDRAAVLRALDQVRPDWVFNAAAFTAVDLCEQRVEEAERVNRDGARVLAEACSGRARLIHLSTEYVFSGDASRPIAEDAPASPRSVYGRTKWEGEEAIRAACADALIVRTQWLFGPGKNFVRTILAAARRGEPLRVVEDQLGRPTGTDALAPGLWSAAERGLRGTLHFACEGIASWFDFAHQIVLQGAERGLCPRVRVDPVASEVMARPARRPAYGVLALDRSRAAGIVLPHWQEALSMYLDREAKYDG
jgi:dTDP-4-dehydrorhamnose reductase